MANEQTYQALGVDTLGQRLGGVEAVASRVGGNPAEWHIREVGDGNLNLVFIVTGSTGSVVVKQALPYVRMVGESWPLPCSRVGYEAEALRTHARCCPDFTPAVYHVDVSMALLAMEYVRPPSKILRYGLIEGTVYPHLAEQLGRHCADTLFKTSNLHLGSSEHRAMQAHFCGNVEMCKLSEQVVFTEPYMASAASNNRWTAPQLDGAAAALSSDAALGLEVRKLKRQQNWYH